jgi:hypothetical protein
MNELERDIGLVARTSTPEARSDEELAQLAELDVTILTLAKGEQVPMTKKNRMDSAA